jgi:hypothetical protein
MKCWVLNPESENSAPAMAFVAACAEALNELNAGVLFEHILFSLPGGGAPCISLKEA